MAMDIQTEVALRTKIEEHIGGDLRQFSALEAIMFCGSVKRNEAFLRATIMTLLQTEKISLVKRDK